MEWLSCLMSVDSAFFYITTHYGAEVEVLFQDNDNTIN